MTPDPRLTLIRCERCGVGGDEVARLRADVARLEAENRRLRETCLPILHMAEALHRRKFGMKCDHDEDCWCSDEEAQSSETLRRARAALEGDDDE